jgi:hypothetical protein
MHQTGGGNRSQPTGLGSGTKGSGGGGEKFGHQDGGGDKLQPAPGVGTSGENCAFALEAIVARNRAMIVGFILFPLLCKSAAPCHEAAGLVRLLCVAVGCHDPCQEIPRL